MLNKKASKTNKKRDIVLQNVSLGRATLDGWLTGLCVSGGYVSKPISRVTFAPAQDRYNRNATVTPRSPELQQNPDLIGSVANLLPGVNNSMLHSLDIKLVVNLTSPGVMPA